MNTQIATFHARLLLAVQIDSQEIGRRIRDLRAGKGWTQMVFAQKANVSISTVQRWERGALPPIRELIRVAAVLEVDPKQLVEEDDPADSNEQERLARIEAGLEELRGMVTKLLR